MSEIDAQKKINQNNIDFLRESIYPKELMSLGDRYYDAIVTRCLDKSRPGWVKVSIVGITDELAVKDQPWAEPAPSHAFIVPSAGTHVKVTFREGDVHYPIWHGANAQDNGKYYPSNVANKDYPNNHVIYRSNEGTSIKNNIKTGEMTIEHSSGTVISMTKDGKYKIGKESMLSPHKKYKGVTCAAICPYLSTLSEGAPVPHPTGLDPIVEFDDISAGAG